MTLSRSLFKTFILSIIFLFSQPVFGNVIPYLIAPSEVDSISNLLETTLEDVMVLGAPEIKDHLDNLFAAKTFDPSCRSSSISILGRTPSSVSFSIPYNSDAIQYRISYLNLITGTKITEEMPVNSQREYTLNAVPDGLYLFSVQQDCIEGASLVWIIIEDKNLLRHEVDPYDSLTCGCEVVGNPIQLPIGFGGGWPNTGLYEKFQVEVTYSEVMLPAIFSGRKEIDSDTDCEIIRLNIECSQYVTMEPIQEGHTGVIQLYEKPGSWNGYSKDLLGTLTVDFPSYTPKGQNWPDLNSIVFKFCEPVPETNISVQGHRIVTGTGSESGIAEVFPNPIDNEINFEYIFSQNSIFLETSIYRSDGILMKRKKATSFQKGDVYKDKFDASAFGPGFYYLVLKSENSVKTFPIIKN